MISQKLEADQNLNSGKLVIVAEPGNLAELMGLHDELKLRMNVNTEGSVITAPPVETPPGD